jgi:hypothetical protein
MNVIEILKKWYSGETIFDDPHKYPGIIYITLPYQKYHWTASLLRTIVKFYLNHWQWFWGTVIALMALFINNK